MTRARLLSWIAGAAILGGGAILIARGGKSTPASGRLSPRSLIQETANPNGENFWRVTAGARDAYFSDSKRTTEEIHLQPIMGDDAHSVNELVISHLNADSPIYAAGFREQDVIVKVQDTPIGTLSRAVNLIHEIRHCSQLTVQVRRGGELRKYRFVFE